MVSIARSLISSSSSTRRSLMLISSAEFSSCSKVSGRFSLQNHSFIRPTGTLDRVSDCSFPIAFSLVRPFSSSISHLPSVTDPGIEDALKDLLAMNWDEIPDSVITETKKALSKNTDDTTGKEALANVFRAAEAVVEFSGVLVSLRMALDDLNGLSGENVGQLPEYVKDAIRAAYNRYTTYLNSFSSDEIYLRKKVETELGTKMIHLKMRCSGIGSEWGKVTLLGTSGISGSYVELRS